MSADVSEPGLAGETERAQDTSAARAAGAGRKRGVRPAALLAVVAIVTAATLFVMMSRLITGRLNPWAEETKDRSGPALLQSIRDLSRYEAASGDFQVIVDLEKDARNLPGVIRGERTLFIGHGSVNAYVDFGRLTSGAVTVGKDRTTVNVRLPRAQLERTNLDTSRSYVYATRRGLTNRIEDFFGGDPGDQRQLYVLAASKIQTAAQESGLRERADQNTRLMMENMLKALGFRTVTVTTADQG